MRLTWLPLALLLAAPALPAHAATQVRLQFISPSELEEMLRTWGTKRPLAQAGQVKDAEGLGVEPGGSVRGMVPEGITGLSADSRTRSLWVTGTEDAIQSLKNIVRLLDIPARRLQVALQVVRPDAAALEGVKFLDVSGAGSQVRAATLSDAQAAKLTAGASLFSAELPGLNNRPVRFFPPAATGLGQCAAITARINGDGTITLIALTTGAPAGTPGSSGPLALRRISSGETALVLTKDGTALLLRAEILPEPVETAGPVQRGK